MSGVPASVLAQVAAIVALGLRRAAETNGEGREAVSTK
jgi:hypothetical protein